MQRVSPRALLLTGAAIGALVASLLIVFMLMGSSTAPKAQAIVPTKTPAVPVWEILANVTSVKSVSPLVLNVVFKDPGTPIVANDEVLYAGARWQVTAVLAGPELHLVAAPCAQQNAAAYPQDSTTVYEPKPCGQANFGGLFDVDAGPGLYHCIVRTDASTAPSGGEQEVKTAAQCYTEFATGLGSGEPPCAAQHGTAATPAPVVAGEGNCNGHVDPPPYSPLIPSKLEGNYCAAAAAPGCSDPGLTDLLPGGTLAADELITVGCFADIGGALGPNVVTVTHVPQVKAQDPAATVGTVSNGTADLHTAATNAQCTAAQNETIDPGLGPPLTIPITLTRRATSRDFDGDGCTDMDELWADKIGATGKCGDDPWNPNDPTGGSPVDVSGSYDITAEAVRADVGLPGLYYDCKSDIQQSVKNLTARILCYIDSPGITVNAQVANCAVNPGPTCSTAGVNGCPPAAPKFCGDGLPGAAPPGCDDTAATCATLAGQGAGCPTLPCNVSQYQFADIDTKHTQLTGVYNKTTNNMELSGCFEDSDGLGQLGNVKIIAKINVHTGIGKANIWILQTPANCIDFSPAAMLAKGPGVQVEISMARQDPGDKAGGCTPNPGVGYTGCRDSDGDGCPDKRELADTAGGTGTGGGLRDPWNRWDYFNPEKPNTPHQQTVADILYVVGKYGKNQGNALYTIDADRTAIVGGNTWNLGPPDGQQTVADILAAVKQYNQNC
jgi:hypothetical protein